MAHFVKFPPVDVDVAYGQWVLKDEAIYESDVGGTVTVPAGFKTDFASIPPWVPRRIADPAGHSRKAAVIHDYLCRTAESRKQRALGDRIFREAMLVVGVPRWRAWMMWAAVRLQTAVKKFD